jgi:nitrogen fixation NifU-like protein
MTDDLYQQTILDHYKNPHNFGPLPDPTCQASETNASCGDKLTLELKLDETTNPATITDAKFTGSGCVVCIASASLLTDYLKGKPITKVEKIDLNFMQQLIGTNVSPGRLKCVTLSAKAVLTALETALKS